MAGFRLASVRDQQRMRRRWSINDLGIAAPPGLPPLTNTDAFSTNTISSYTVHQDSGTPVWGITSGLMQGATALGLQSVLTRNGFSAADCSVECVSAQLPDGGLVLRYQDQNNFYLLALSDDSGANPTQNLRLFKRVGGTFTQLGSPVDVTFTAGGSPHTFRLTISGNNLTAYMDGVSKITATDSATTAAGAVGMRANSNGGNFYDTFNWG
jgi:hypothetical protein